MAAPARSAADFGKMRPMHRTRLAWLALSFSAGCAAAGSAHTPMPNPAGPQTLVRETRADAAKRAGVDVERATVLASESVTWRDGSLGCPAPGMNYTQALVPGWRVRVEAGGRTWEYHADLRGRWQWCSPERIQEPTADRAN